MSKPSEAAKKHLAKLFPSTSATSKMPKILPAKRKFDPSQTSIAEIQKGKKKAAISKPKMVSFVLLARFQAIVPRGKARKKLVGDSRIKKVQIRRSMSSQQVHDIIVAEFAEFEKVSSFHFLCTGKDNALDVFSKQELDGCEVVELAGSGSVYLVEVSYTHFSVSYLSLAS